MWIFEVLYKIIVDFIQKKSKKELEHPEEEELSLIHI